MPVDDSLLRSADRLLIGNLRSAQVHLHPELPLQLLNDHLHMRLSHSGKKNLSGLLIPAHHDRRIFLVDSGKGGRNLLLISFRFGCECIGDHGQGQFGLSENNGVLLIAEGIASGGLLQFGHGDNVPHAGKPHRLLLFPFQQEDLADPLLYIFFRIVNGRIGVDTPRIDPEEAQLSCEGVGDRFKDESGERAIFLRFPRNNLSCLHILSLSCSFLLRRRETADHQVEKRLGPYIPGGGTADSRYQPSFHRPLPEALKDLLCRDLRGLQIFLHQLIVHLNNSFDHLFAEPVHLFFQFGGNIFQFELPASVLPVEIRLLLNQIYHSPEILFPSDGKLNRDSGL